MLENKMLLTKNMRLRLENNELNIDEIRRMRSRVGMMGGVGCVEGAGGDDADASDAII
ncbi:hypothetical protein Gotur_004605 [Gossypium turneri]